MPTSHSRPSSMLRSDTLLRRSLVLRADGMGQKVIHGASYQFAGIVLRTLITIVSTASLARLLTPADFGLVAMATVVIELGALFGNFGFNALLIQRRRISRLQVDTVFWASLGLGTAIALTVFGLSYVAGLFYADQRVGEVLRVLCLSFVFGSLCTIPNVVLMRLMRFRSDFWINIASVALRTVIAIAAAWAGFGVWSLVAGAVCGSLVQWAMGAILVPYRPRFRFHGAYLAESWRTSGSYFAGGVLFYLNMNVDLTLIGRQLGATALGYYQNARSLTDEVRTRIALPLQRVLFPAFASLQEDRERIRKAVLRSSTLLAAVTFPIGVGVCALAPEIVPVLYGAQWLPMVPALGLFGLSAAMRASTAIATPLFNAHNRAGLALRYSVVATVLMVAAVLIAMPYGITAAAAGVALVSIYNLLPFVAALRLVGLGWKHAGAVLLPPAFASACAWACIAIGRPTAAEWVAAPSVMLVLGAVLGALVYAAVLNLISGEYRRELRDLLSRK